MILIFKTKKTGTEVFLGLEFPGATPGMVVRTKTTIFFGTFTTMWENVVVLAPELEGAKVETSGEHGKYAAVTIPLDLIEEVKVK